MRFAQHFDRWFNSAELRALSDTVDMIDDLLLGELADRAASCGWAVLDAVSAGSVRTPAESASTPSNTTNAPDGLNSHAGPTIDQTASIDLELLVDELLHDQLIAFVLTQLLGHRYEEAADICVCATEIIRSRVARARAHLASTTRSEDLTG